MMFVRSTQKYSKFLFYCLTVTNDLKTYILTQNKLMNTQRQVVHPSDEEAKKEKKFSGLISSDLVDILPEDIINEIDALLAPEGFDKELWKELDAATRVSIKHMLHERAHPNEKRKSHFMRFLTDSKFYIGNRIEEALNSMALILALLLTIPFGTLSSFDSNYFESIRIYLEENCEDKRDSYTYIRIISLTNCWMTIYSSMCGLVMVVLYYVFKPSDAYELRKFGLLKGRILLACAGICTIISIIGVMDSAANFIQWYNVPFDESLCQGTPSYYTSMLATGLVAIALSAAIPFYLLLH
jgi:hypothetical protein